MVSQQIGLETSGLGFGRLCECLGGIIFTFVTFSHERHFHLSSGISLSLPVPISLPSFAFIYLSQFVPPIASANLPPKTHSRAPSKMQRKTWILHTLHTVFCEYFEWPLRVQSSHYRHTFPHWSGHTRASTVCVHIIGSRNKEITSTILCLDEYFMMHLNPNEMHQIKEIRMTAWCFIDHKPFLELWVFAENKYFW